MFRSAFFGRRRAAVRCQCHTHKYVLFFIISYRVTQPAAAPSLSSCRRAASGQITKNTHAPPRYNSISLSLAYTLAREWLTKLRRHRKKYKIEKIIKSADLKALQEKKMNNKKKRLFHALKNLIGCTINECCVYGGKSIYLISLNAYI